MKVIQEKVDAILYSRWSDMKRRCYAKNSTDYHRYGGIGITVCNEWKDDFQAFYGWAIANGFLPDLQLDKDILCDHLGISPKIYSPDTCKWVTRAENVGYSNKDRGSIPVYQYTLSGEFIEGFDSALKASESTGTTHSNITRVCNGVRDTAGGFQWRRQKETSIPKHVPVTRGFTVLQLDKHTSEVLNEYANAQEAVEALGRSNPSPIQQICSGTLLPSGRPRQSAYGYKWKRGGCHEAIHRGELPMKKE